MTDAGASTATPQLIVITDVTRAPEAVVVERIAAVARAATPGSVLVQLRDRQLSARRRLALGRQLGDVTRRYRQLLAVNDRLDLAVLLGADWVHLGEGSVSCAEARSVLPPGVRVSRACHDPEAPDPDADAVLLSPVCAARKGKPALGEAGVRRARGRCRPGQRLFALGGVTGATADGCLAAGADGVAVIGAVLDGGPPAPLLAALGIAAP